MKRIKAWERWWSSHRWWLRSCGLADCLLRVACSSGDDGPWGVHDRCQGRWLLPGKLSKKQPASVQYTQQVARFFDIKWIRNGPQEKSKAFLGLTAATATEMLTAGESEKPSDDVLDQGCTQKVHALLSSEDSALPRPCRPTDNRATTVR